MTIQTSCYLKKLFIKDHAFILVMGDRDQKPMFLGVYLEFLQAIN